jgi:hypothetical protein
MSPPKMTQASARMTSCYLYLQPTGWSQQIRRYPRINVEGPYLSVPCRTLPDSDLVLSDGYKLSDLEIALAIFQGEPDAKEREQLSARAIGGIWWLREQAFIHGQFYLRADDYAAIWDQVRDGGYAACRITLGVSPVQDTDQDEYAWNSNPLSIESAAVDFTRETIPKKPANIEKDSFAWSKGWAVLLFIIASIAWFFPQWNGLFFEPSKDVTTGEGRIVAAVLFVGGLLLWFLGSPRSDGARDRK